MTDAPSTHTPGTPYGATGQPKPPGGTQFFDWVRSLGFVRGRDRWLGGVCGAIAARTGLDPLIVRGIAVVIAILGGPIFFLYAVGWALIPDETGLSLVEQITRQVFEPAMIAVGVLLLLTFVPWMQGIWWQGPPEVWGMPGWLEVLLRTSWAIGLTVGIILLVIYIAKRVPSPRTPASGYPASGYPASGYPASGGYPAGGAGAPSTPSTPSAPSAPFAPSTPFAPPATSGAAASVTTDAVGSVGAPTTATFVPPVPDPPTAGSGPVGSGTAGAPPSPSLWDDLVGGAKTAPPYGSAPYGSAPYGSAPYGSAPYGSTPSATPASSDTNVYRELHQSKHLGAGFISVVAGVALSVGAVAASFVADGSWSNSAFLIGAAAALAVIALGIVVAGILGKEGGWLNAFSIVLAATMVWTAFIPVGTDVATFGESTWEYGTSDPAGISMIAGEVTVDLTELDDTPSSESRTVDVWLAFGDVELVLPENRTVAVQAGALAGGIDYDTPDQVRIERDGVLLQDSRIVSEGSGTGVTTVRVRLAFGEVIINQPVEPARR